MDKNKRVWSFTVFVVVCVLLIGCGKNARVEDEWTREEFNDKYDMEAAKEVLGDFEVTFKDTSIVFDATTPEKTKDNLLCTLMYSVRIKNISDEAKTISAKYFLPKDLFEKLSMSRESFETVEEVSLEPGKGFTYDIGILMKHFDLLNDSEKEVYESRRNDMELILKVDGRSYFIKIEKGQAVH